MVLNLRQHLNKTTPTVDDFVLANTQGAMLKFFMVLNVAATQLSAKTAKFCTMQNSPLYGNSYYRYIIMHETS